MGVFGADAYAPKEVAERVQAVGVLKAQLPMLSMIALGILAGGFIGLGAVYYTVVTSDASLGFAGARVLGGLSFSLGLILVVVAGAELFTGNNLMVMAWVSKRVTLGLLLRNLAVVYGANFVGAAGLALLVVFSGHGNEGEGAVAARALAIAEAKVALPLVEAFFQGVLCNILVCLAVWLAMAARTVTGKIAAIVFPISAFVAAGFEHCVANMYFIPLGLFLEGSAGIRESETLSWLGMFGNLGPVTLGNLVGGAVMVGLVYYVIYVRPDQGE